MILVRNLRLYRRVADIVRKFDALNKVMVPGYLSDSEYQWVLKNSKAVVAVTNREYTMLSAIWEAIGFERPFIASETKAIRSVVGDYPYLFKLSNSALSKTLNTCLYESDIDLISKPVINRLKKLSLESIENLKNLLKTLAPYPAAMRT